MTKFGIFLFFVVLFYPAITTNSNSIPENEIIEEILEPDGASILLASISKPPLDRRNYRALLLKNGMKVILVSDPNTTRTAASLSISVGSINDPENLMGLAHFVEHMLFLGNEKYPEENGFQKYISEHGGYSNAATQSDKTYYFFRVSPPALEESLERFAHLFISPLFTESAIEREVLAIESEHQKYIPNDPRRIERIEAQTGRSGHPFTQYRTGSFQTLWTSPLAAGLSIRASLFDFHLKYYSSNLMHLAILGSQSLDELQSMTEKIFLEIPNRNVTPTWAQEIPPLYGDSELRERIDIVPMGNIRSMQLIFPVDYVQEYYKNTALGYISHLLGQEGKGSLSAFLKKKHYAESVIVGGYLPTRGLTFFKVKLILSQDGLANVNKIVKHIFQYIEMVRKIGPQLWFWEEVRDLNLIDFRFRDELYPIDLVSKLTVHMVSYPVEKVLHASGIDESLQFDPLAINRTLDLLTPQNCRLIVTSTEFENTTQHTEQFFGVAYNRNKIESDVIADWTNVGDSIPQEFHMPTPNEFIPSQFDLKQRDNQSLDDPLTPRKLMDTNLSQVWYLQDTSFLLPKASVSVELLSPVAYMNPVNANLIFLWSNLITQSLGEFQYTGSLAGLQSEVDGSEGGLQLTIKGFDHKLPHFLSKIFERILNFSLGDYSNQHFQTSKDSMLQILLNVKHAQPIDLADRYLQHLMLEKRWTIGELLDAIDEVSISKMEAFISDFLSRLKFRWIFYGNLVPEECVQVVEEIEAIFIENGTRPLFPTQSMVHMRVVEIPKGSNFLFTAEQSSHSSSCTVVLFQVGLDSTRSVVLVQLLSRLSHNAAFDRLRTKEQLGYAVFSDVYVDKYYSTVSFRIVVQGSGTPSFVESRIDTFLIEFEQVLTNMTEKEFLRHRKSLSNIKSTQAKTMTDKVGTINREIVSGRRNFHRFRVELEALESIGLKNLREFFNETVANPATRRRLAIHILPTVSASEDAPNNHNSTSSSYLPLLLQNETLSITATIIEDIVKWKQTLHLFPSRNPFKIE